MIKPLPQIKRVELLLRDKPYQIEYFIRSGYKGNILFVHGLGGAKENFWEATKASFLDGYALLCFDNPGTGNSTYHNDEILNVDDLTSLLISFIDALDLKELILVGASMGGLITLLYFKLKGLSNVKAYINIEGNLMPEDCMFSSKVVKYEYEVFVNTEFEQTIHHMKQNGNPGYYIIANNLELNTHVGSYYHYSFQTVSYSASGELLQQFLGLALPRLFIYGDKNHQLSYIPKLKALNLQCQMITSSDHFVFYDNPKEMYQKIASFLDSLP